jgi:predicted cupin superfamily sugar epimerase
MNKAEFYISKLNLTRHVEGGSFTETYRSNLILPQLMLGNAFNGNRPASTGIYFLLEYGQFSAFHRIASDEMWHFYDGDTLSIYEIDSKGELHKHLLGRNIEAGEHFQCVIKAGSWFGSRCEKEGSFSLVGCTVAPGFDFADFELAKREELCKTYPQHLQLIETLTHHTS